MRRTTSARSVKADVLACDAEPRCSTSTVHFVDLRSGALLCAKLTGASEHSDRANVNGLAIAVGGSSVSFMGSDPNWK